MSKQNAETLAYVLPLMVRRIIPLGLGQLFGGVIVLDEYDVEDVGLADKRLEYDEDVVDCSYRIFDITTWMMFFKDKCNFTVFPSRRWRNHRLGIEEITSLPSKKQPLLYIGNPVRLFADPHDGIRVVRIPEFLIKSGPELGF